MKIILLLALSLSAFAQEFSFPIKDTQHDLNGDGHMETITWTASAKGVNKPDKLVISSRGNVLLTYEDNFCKPGEEAGNPDGCIDLQIHPVKEGKVTNLEMRKVDTQSSVDQHRTSYIYRWVNNEFVLKSATAVTTMTGHDGSKKRETYEINYLKGTAIVTKDKTISKCSVKNLRKNEKLSDFSLFDVAADVQCK
ncbi:MAG: hypothetical protein ACJ76H_03140 [Bacteriovoracaceae bacterium]